MDTQIDVLIVGAGVAGFSAAQTLRELSPDTSLMLVEAEARLPYKRTKLSKFLAEGFEHDSFALENDSWYADNQVILKAGVRVLAINPGQSATLSDGDTVRWKRLLLTIGARPVMPALSNVGEWLVLRNQDDTIRLRERWAEESDVVILGNGVLGVEIADQAVALGKAVRLWGRTPLPLHRELTPAASRLLAHTLSANGVRQELPGTEEIHWGVAAVGSLPDLDLARTLGLAVDRGVLVDADFRTSIDSVWSAGDGTQLPDGTVSHLWHQSEAQGRAAARSMLGMPAEYSARPWRLKCEVFGTYWFSMNKPERRPDVERETGVVYQAFWYNAGRLEAAVMANDKANNKLYEKAVVEGWTRDQVDLRLPL